MNTGREVIPLAFYFLLPRQHAMLMHRLQPDPQFLMIFFGILTAQSVIQYNNFKSGR